MNIVELIRDQARRNPYHKAVVFPEKKNNLGKTRYSHYTFQRIDQESDFLAEKLQGLGIRKKTLTLLFVKPSLEFPLVVFSLLKIGAIPILIDPGMGRKNLLRAIAEVKPHALISAPIVHYLSGFFPNVFRSVKCRITTGSWGLRAIPLTSLLPPASMKDFSLFRANDPKKNDIAAILFTSGGTGKPKGVIYTHSIFACQIDILRNMFALQQGDKDLPGFPLFSLLTMAMGITSVIPPMDPSKPSQANPKKLVDTIEEQGITLANGSPAIWENVAEYCLKHNRKLPSLKSLMMFGAPVSSKLVAAFAKILVNGDTYTPYGATECLPVACLSGSEILNGPAKLSLTGKGTCVGFPVAKSLIKIIRASQEKVENSQSWTELKPMEVGEIIVYGRQVTPGYFNRPTQTDYSKIPDREGGVWHRMGDLGYLDHEGRLWFCGRQAHSFLGSYGMHLSVPSEAIFNKHPDVRRSALIGLSVPQQLEKKPCLVLERHDGRVVLQKKEKEAFRSELINLGKDYKHTAMIDTFFLHHNFPVDPRHNIKIDRLSLGRLFSRKRDKSL